MKKLILVMLLIVVICFCAASCTLANNISGQEGLEYSDSVSETPSLDAQQGNQVDGVEDESPGEKHDHTFASTWSSNETEHWHAATCEHSDKKADKEVHDWGDAVVTREADEENEGIITYECKVCAYKKQEKTQKVIASEGLSFETLTDKTCRLTGRGSFSGTSLIVPSVHNGKKVSNIAENAFRNDDSLVSITIPRTITSIGENAFKGCYRIVEVCNRSSLDIEKGSEKHGGIALYARSIERRDLKGILYTNDAGYQIYEKDSKGVLLNYSGQSRQVKIPVVVAEIAPYAFYNKSTISSVEIPESVKIIGEKAFEGCKQVTSFSAGYPLDQVSEDAFSDLTNIRSLTVYGNLTFYFYDKNITSLTITGGGIPDTAFASCPKIESLTLQEGVLYIGDHAFSNGFGLSTLNIPDSVTKIGNEAFYNCKNLKSITYGKGIPALSHIWTTAERLEYKNAIGRVDPRARYGTFASFSESNNITIVASDMTVEIVNGAVQNCIYENGVAYYGNEKNPYHSGALVGESGTITVREGCKVVCGELSPYTYELVLPNSLEDYYVTYNAYNNLNGIATSKAMRCNVKNGSRYFGNSSNPYMVLVGTTQDAPTTINVDKNCKFICFLNASGGGQHDYSNVEGMYFEGTLEQWFKNKHHDSYFSYNHGKCKMYIGGEELCGDIVIPDGVEKLDTKAFLFTHNITSLSIPKSVVEINCTISNMNKITVDEENPVFKVINGVLYNMETKTALTSEKALERIDIEEGTLRVLSNVFSGISGATPGAVTIPDSVLDITISNNRNKLLDFTYFHNNILYANNGVSASQFRYYSSTGAFIIPQEWDEYMRKALSEGLEAWEEGGVKYYGNTENPYLIAYQYVDKSKTEIVLNENCRFIAKYAFYNASNLTHITLPDGLVSIGESAFNTCKALTEIVIPNSVKFVDCYAFEYCSGLLSAVISDSLTEIPYWMFYSCNKLASVHLPSSLRIINDQAFCSTAITDLEIPSTVRAIKKGAFSSTKIKNVVVAGDILIMEKEVFRSCSSLEKAKIESQNELVIEGILFENCSALSEVELNGNIIEIRALCYKNTNLITAKLPIGLQKFGTIFSECGKLKNVIYPGTISQYRSTDGNSFGLFTWALKTIQCSNGTINVEYAKAK